MPFKCIVAGQQDKWHTTAGQYLEMTSASQDSLLAEEVLHDGQELVVQVRLLFLPEESLYLIDVVKHADGVRRFLCV